MTMTKTTMVMMLLGAAMTGRADAALTGHWKLDEASGTIARATVGTNDGRLGPAAAFVAGGVSSRGVQLAPTSATDDRAYVELPSAVGKLGFGEFSIAFWVKTARRTDTRPVDLVGNRVSVGHGNFVSVRLRGDGTVSAELDADASGSLYAEISSGRVRVDDDEWHRVVVTRNPTTFAMWIDGAVAARAQVIIPINVTGAAPFRVGRSMSASVTSVASVPMSIDDLRVFNDALSPTEIHYDFFASGGSRAMTRALVRMYAPALRLDHDAVDYPASAQDFYDTVIASGDWRDDHPRYSNRNWNTILAAQIPVYTQTVSCGDQLRIQYWFFYGYQNKCTSVDVGGWSSHNGDWERVVVTLSEDATTVAAVTYHQHDGRYTRTTRDDGFGLEESTHPIVYVGKIAHGSYFNSGGNAFQCGYFDDYRNPSDKNIRSWNNLRSLDLADGPLEGWMLHDLMGGFTWGHDGISTHPMQKAPDCSMKACDSSGCSADQVSAQDVPTNDAGLLY